MKSLGRCVLGMVLSVNIGTSEQEHVYSGFLTYYRGKHLWVTAGHVIDNLIEVRASGADIKIMRWLDRYPLQGAEAAQVHDRNLVLSRADDIDVGYAIIRGFDADALSRNRNLRLVNDQLWSDLDSSTPEGYYLIGYPNTRMSVSLTRVAEKEDQKTLRTSLLCLPIQRIEHRRELQHIDFWNDAEAFYGQILPSQEAHKLNRVTGMSGAPVFSIERLPDGNVFRGLIGLQSKQWVGESIIRIEPIRRAIEAIGQTIS